MADDYELPLSEDEGSAPETEVERAESRLEEAASRAGLSGGVEDDRAAEAQPAAKDEAPPAPRPTWEQERWGPANEKWRTDPSLRWHQRREQGRARAAEKRAQELLDAKLAKIEEAIGGLATGKTADGEAPDFDLDQKGYIDQKFQDLRSFVEEQYAPLKETLAERAQRQKAEAEEAENAGRFNEWAQDRAEWVAEAERVYVGGDPRRAGEYNFYKGLVADTCYQQGRLLFGEERQAQSFARSAMLSMTDLAERTGTNPAALVEMLGRQQMMVSLQQAQSLGFQIIAPGAAASAAAQPASRVRDQREFIESAEAGGAAPPPAARTNGKAPRDGNFLQFVTKTLADKGQRQGMVEVQKEGARRYGTDWPRVNREMMAQIRGLGRGAA